MTLKGWCACGSALGRRRRRPVGPPPSPEVPRRRRGGRGRGPGVLRVAGCGARHHAGQDARVIDGPGPVARFPEAGRRCASGHAWRVGATTGERWHTGERRIASSSAAARRARHGSRRAPDALRRGESLLPWRLDGHAGANVRCLRAARHRRRPGGPGASRATGGRGLRVAAARGRCGRLCGLRPPGQAPAGRGGPVPRARRDGGPASPGRPAGTADAEDRGGDRQHPGQHPAGARRDGAGRSCRGGRVRQAGP